MKEFNISYADAASEFDNATEQKTFPILTAVNCLKLRLPGGKNFKNLRWARELNRAAGSDESSEYLSCCRSKMILGKSLANKLSPGINERVEAYVNNLKEYDITYKPSGYLYHFAVKDDLESIRREGLVSEKFEKGEVFMTDDPVELGWFPTFKVRKIKRDAVICLLKIDAVGASSGHRMKYYKKNEIVTDHIPPEYIEWD